MSNGVLARHEGDSLNTTVIFSLYLLGFFVLLDCDCGKVGMIFYSMFILQIFVGGLDSSVSEEDLRQPFAKFGEIVSVKIPIGKGCGFIQFVNRYHFMHY